MQYLYLPGFSKMNENELSSFKNYFHSKDTKLIAHKWRHWADDSVEFAPKIETEMILKMLVTNRPVTLISKSIGTYVGAILSSKVHFDKAILMGVPYRDLNDEERAEYSNYLSSDIAVIQRERDFHGFIEDAQKIIKPKNAHYIVLKGETHQYDVPDIVYNLLEQQSE